MMIVDGSSLGASENKPQSFTVSQKGSVVTFEPISGGGSGTMTATVTRQGATLVMKGKTVAIGKGWKMNAVFTVSKPE